VGRRPSGAGRVANFPKCAFKTVDLAPPLGDPWDPVAERVTAAAGRDFWPIFRDPARGQSERLHVPCFSQTTQQKNDIDVPRGTIFSEKNRKPRAEVRET